MCILVGMAFLDSHYLGAQGCELENERKDLRGKRFHDVETVKVGFKWDNEAQYLILSPVSVP